MTINKLPLLHRIIGLKVLELQILSQRGGGLDSDTPMKLTLVCKENIPCSISPDLIRVKITIKN